MRVLLVLLGVATLVLAALMSFGFINLDQTRPLVVQAPRFKASLPEVSVGMENRTVEVPTLDVQKPANNQ